MLTNNPNAPCFDPPNRGSDIVANKDYRLIDMVKASAAAPTFFDGQKVTIAYDDSEKPTEEGYFVDRAVGAFNNPGVQLLLRVLIPAYGFSWRSGSHNLMMASLGTGARAPRAHRAQVCWRASPPLQRGIDAVRSMNWDTQVQGVMPLQALSQPRKPWRINGEVGDMGGRCALPAPVLDYQRVDVELTRKDPPRREKRDRTAIETLLERQLDHRVLANVDQLAKRLPREHGPAARHRPQGGAGLWRRQLAGAALRSAGVDAISGAPQPRAAPATGGAEGTAARMWRVGVPASRPGRRRNRTAPHGEWTEARTGHGAPTPLRCVSSGRRRRLPDDNLARARNRLRSLRDRLAAGTLSPAEARAQVQAWRAQADFAHGEHLQRAMLQGLPEDVRQRPRGQRRRRRKVPPFAT